MQRRACLALCAALAAGPGCAHRQLTNQEFAVGAVVVVAVAGLLVLEGMSSGCDRTVPCPKPRE